MNKFSVGFVLVMIGVVLLVGGVSHATQDRSKVGPVAIEYPEEHRIPYSPLGGGLLTLTGGALMLIGRSKVEGGIDHEEGSTGRKLGANEGGPRG